VLHYFSLFSLSIELAFQMTQPAPTLPVARFVGCRSVGKQRLVRALLEQDGAKQAGSAEARRDGDDDGKSSSTIRTPDDPDNGDSSAALLLLPPSLPWQLDTRYYSATLSLERSRIAEEEEGEEEEEEEALGDSTEEAVVLVFDPRRAGTFAATARWWSRRSSPPSNADEDEPLQPAVKLCVAHSEGGDGGDELLRGEAEAWCIDNAFELIEVSSTSSSSSTLSSSSLPPSESENGGVARLRDALAAHAWPGLVRKAPGEVEAARRAAVAEAERNRRRGRKEGGERGGEDDDDDDDDDDENGNGNASYTPPLAELNDDGDEDLLRASSTAPSLTGFAAACTGAAGVEGLEDLFRSLSAARASVAALPDEERRERAAEMALRLAEALGIEDAGSEGDEDSSENDEEEERRRRREV